VEIGTSSVIGLNPDEEIARDDDKDSDLPVRLRSVIGSNPDEEIARDDDKDSDLPVRLR
jgi:hypothetical protein